VAKRIGPIRDRRFEQLPKPPGRLLMNVRGDAASRGMTAHDRIRLTGSFAEVTAPLGDDPSGAGHFVPAIFRDRSLSCGATT